MYCIPPLDAGTASGAANTGVQGGKARTSPLAQRLYTEPEARARLYTGAHAYL